MQFHPLGDYGIAAVHKDDLVHEHEMKYVPMIDIFFSLTFKEIACSKLHMHVKINNFSICWKAACELVIVITTTIILLLNFINI